MKLAWVLLAACGGGSGGGGDDVGLVDAPASVPGNRGSVVVQGFKSSNANGGTATASFTMGTGGCPVTTLDNCVLTQACAAPAAQPVSAGTVTATGAAVPISLAPKADATYPMLSDYMATAPWLAGGETVDVTATGATVPAFHGTVTAPNRPTITAPAMPAAGAMLAVTRASGFSTTWTGGGAGKLEIYLSSGSTTLVCDLDASAGSGTIPAATLAMLPAGSGAFAMSSISTHEVDAGDWAVQLVGYYNAVWQSGGAIVSGGATFQ